VQWLGFALQKLVRQSAFGIALSVDNAAHQHDALPASARKTEQTSDADAHDFQRSKEALKAFFFHAARGLASGTRLAWGSLNRAALQLRQSWGPMFARKAQMLRTAKLPNLPVLPHAQAIKRALRRVARVRWLGGLALAAVAFSAVILYLLASLPLGGGIAAESQGAMTFESADGSVFAGRGVLKGQQLGSIAEVPPHLTQAVIAIEDRRFYDHPGIDLRAIFRAAWRNSVSGGVREGGSTITQQLARLLYLSQERSMKRKLQEALLAFWLESKLTKDEILTRYLNTAFFGAGAYGVDAAARRYFGKTPKDLSLAESAMLAGLIRAPSQLAPTRNFGGAKERADVVLDAMIAGNFITAEAAEAARAQSVNLRSPPETPPGSNFFVDMVTNDFRRFLGPLVGDVRLQTTIDLELQNLAQGVIERRLDAEGTKRRVSQAALVAIRRDGAIVAMVGGRDYEASQFNRAVQARRQPGSLFKVFVYDAALQRGLTPASMVVDRPVQIGDWEPENYGGGFRGPMPARAAFANSVNTVAVQLAEQVGVQAIIDSARKLGVQSPLPSVPALALGAGEVTLLEMTKAYAAIGFGVQTIEPYAIRAIVGPQDQALYTKGKAATEISGASQAARSMLVELMQAVVEGGTGKAARIPGVPVAGKTGTTQENRDAWFIGFTPEMAVGVWVGNDDNAPMNGVTGGDLPARIWHEFMDQAMKRRAKVAVPTPAPRTTERAEETGGPLRGRADVIDTATLAIDGRAVALFGVQVNPDRRAARALAHFLRRREVQCAPAPDPASFRCSAGGQDIAEAIVGAGVAPASANASQDLLAVEELARAQRVGIWRRGDWQAVR
jgi:penicillin-binding protein 1A